jgi:selenide,water dikinase
VLGDLSAGHDDRVLIDYRTSDDAGVYKLDERRALVQTVDFFTPIVDDPFTYGQIAAANALSDVYAMGGHPLTALAIAGFPQEAERAALKAIFAGGLAKLREADVALLGGHTVQDSEIKFGYAVTGEVEPDRIWSNAGARTGDVLFLTKPLGTGVIATALKFGRAPEAVIAGAIGSMLALNRAAADALLSLARDAVHACTDITGFGLIGHASEMAAASARTIEIEAVAVPLLSGASALVLANTPGGGRTNAAYFGPVASIGADVDPAIAQLFHDPQTSGGLLAAVRSDFEAAAREAFRVRGVAAVRIGGVAPASAHRVVVR